MRISPSLRGNTVGVLNANPNPGAVVAPPPAFANLLASNAGVNLERLPIPTPGTGPSTFRVENDAILGNTVTNTQSGFGSSLTVPYAATPYVWNLVPVGSLFP